MLCGWLGVCLAYVLLHYSGMLTITDFINILRHHYKSPIVSHHTPTQIHLSSQRPLPNGVLSLSLSLSLHPPQVGMDELENESIQQWRDSERKVARVTSTLVRIDPEQRYIYMYMHYITCLGNVIKPLRCIVCLFEVQAG